MYKIKQGDFYPDLRHIRMTVKKGLMFPPLDLNNKPTDSNEIRVDMTNICEIQIPERDWNNIMEIYRAHFHAINTHPAVRDLWHQYKMMAALTENHYG